jgi:4-hydroxythreonine-4-phosphate dehydrogenase
MSNLPETHNRVRVGITHGDVNGISYEIIIKTLLDQRLMENYTITVYGSSKVASYHRKIINANELNFNVIKKADQAHPRKPNIVNIHDEEVKLELGKSTTVAGELALLSLEAAIAELKEGHIDVLVTSPINKKNIQSANFNFPGHTEYLAQKFGIQDYLMLMVNRKFRIGVVTGHIALNKVSQALSEDLIYRKIKIMDESLRRDFGIVRPRIAVMALNPHAGDAGLIGDEDQRMVKPAVDRAFNDNIMAFGPYPADGFFGSGSFKEFDGILAMYHDQGLIPFKLLSFDEGVNFTAGLPIIRTSPAHGTAYDIAGKDLANPEAFRNALYMACDIFLHRKEYDELMSNALKPGTPPAETSQG